MTGDAEARRTLDALAACDLGLARFTAIDIAVESRTSQVIASVLGEGIGAPERLTCVGERLFGGAADRWQIAGEGDAATIRLDGGAAIGHVRGPDQVIFASAGWDGALRERLAGGGASPAVGPLGEALAGLDHGRAIWFAGQVPALGGEAENLTSLAGAIDLDAGLALDLDMRAASPAIAAGIRAELDRRLGNIRQRLAKSGLPQAAIDRVTIAQEGPALRVRAALEIDEIRAIRRLLAESRGAEAEAAGRAPSERIDQGRPPTAP
ncbi:MAG: hypothetical protein H6710_22905 [Myxococcales bacterium]|nr:hypothetical protein [Myxococcales bacterium]